MLQTCFAGAPAAAGLAAANCPALPVFLRAGGVFALTEAHVIREAEGQRERQARTRARTRAHTHRGLAAPAEVAAVSVKGSESWRGNSPAEPACPIPPLYPWLISHTAPSLSPPLSLSRALSLCWRPAALSLTVTPSLSFPLSSPPPSCMHVMRCPPHNYPLAGEQSAESAATEFPKENLRL